MCIRDRDWPARARELIQIERAYLYNTLKALGFTVYAGRANYLLIQTEDIHDLKARLMTQKVLISSCADCPGLDERFYRVAVRTHEENLRLIQALETVI